MAVNGQNLEMMKLLIDNGADINEKDNFHDTILMNAVRENFVDGINLLLDNNVDVSAINDDNKTALMIAEEFAEYNDPEILEILKHHN